MKKALLALIVVWLSLLSLSYADNDGFDEMAKGLKEKTEAIMAGAARSDVEMGIPMRLDLYYIDNGAYPSTEEGLKVLVVKPDYATKWNGPYLRTEKKLFDPWGNPYVYRRYANPDNYIIYSFGPDGKDGTQDDIIYEEIVSEEKQV